MSTRFTQEWLRLREPADRRARAAALLPPLTDWLGDPPVRVADLGAGTGANLRYLAPVLPTPQEWTLVDENHALLARAEPPTAQVTVHRLDHDLTGDNPLPVLRADLVTASALLDLVSHAWLEALARACVRCGSAVLLTLSYDGIVRWEPDDADDARVTELVNAHQRRDKGFGPALGPDSGATAESVFRDHGFDTWLSPSPWRLASGMAPLQEALLEGWLHAALEQAPGERQRLQAWAARRRRAITGGRVTLQVGHLDLLALPPEPR